MKKISIERSLVVMVAALFLTALPLFASKETDERIESAAKNSHVFKSYLNDDSIKVDSKNGVVTLSGTVANASHKSLAEDTVACLPGVKKVHNKLDMKGERAEENSDAWIATKIKSTLLFHRNVSGTKTNVDVKDGVATLSGEANSQAERDLAAEYAKDIDGVKDVNNQITVASASEQPKQTLGDKIDDASITAQVKSVLLYHRSTSALHTKVITQDGIVTLKGTARNASEKDLVTKLVSNINGVKDVFNQMQINPEIKS